MRAEALQACLNDLYERNFLVRSTDKKSNDPEYDKTFDTVFHTRFVFKGRLIDEEIDIVPALPKKALSAIVLGAINGNLPDMSTVAMMYAAGFALPHDLVKAEAWGCFACMQPAPNATYTQAISSLKADHKYAQSRARDEMIWPEEVEESIETVLTKCNALREYKNQPLPRGAMITPRLAGVRINLVYRAYKIGDQFHAHLYGAFLHIGGKIVYTLDQLRYLNIPIELGMHGPRKIIQNYTPFGETAKLYVVQGTLVSPKGLRDDMRQHFPEVRTVKDLIDEYMKDLKRVRIDDFGFVIADLREKLRECEKRLERYAAKPKKYADEIGKLEKRKARLEKRIENEATELEVARAEYVKTLPEHYVRFVASGMFVYQNGKLMGPQMRIKPAVHLQSLGFSTLSHPVVEFVGAVTEKDGSLSGFDNIIAKFESAFDDQYTVTGLTIRPGAQSVNINRCYSITKSKGV
ncbi:hypothetical protein D3C85_333790 [compost metagenome]